MPITFSAAKIQPSEPIVLRDNMQMPVCFSGVAYDIKNVVIRLNGVDFECGGRFFRDIDFNQKKISFVK